MSISFEEKWFRGKEMNAIVVVDKNWSIGKDGDLLVHLPGDLKYYKEKTIGNVIVMGRKTLESFPGGRPLPGRTNIVITRNADFKKEECIVCNSIPEVFKKIEEYEPEKVFVVGGAEIYKALFEHCDTFYVTKIEEEYEADRSFPNLDNMNFIVNWESESQEEKGIKYRFLKYVRNNQG